MASDALQRLNERLGLKAGQRPNSNGQENRKGVETIENPAEAFGAGEIKKPEPGTGEKRKGGWPKGKKRGGRTGRSGTAAAENKTIVEGVSSTLVGVHYLLATALNAPEFELGQEEAKKIALSVQRVSDQYGKVIDPKTEAWVGLIGTVGACYVPRVIAYNARVRAGERGRNPDAKMVFRPASAASPAPSQEAAPVAPDQTIVNGSPTKKEPIKSKDKKGTITPSEVFGAINFGDPDNVQ